MSSGHLWQSLCGAFKQLIEEQHKTLGAVLPSDVDEVRAALVLSWEQKKVDLEAVKARLAGIKLSDLIGTDGAEELKKNIAVLLQGVFKDPLPTESHR